VTEETPIQAKASCRWTRALLFISLAGNLAIVGLVGSAVFHARAPGGSERGAMRDPGAALFLSALEPADRRAMIARLRDEGRGPKASRREAHEQFTTLLTALRASPFNAEIALNVLDAQAKSAEARRALGQQFFVDRITSMSDADRAAFADRLEQVISRRGGRDPKTRDSH